MDRARFVVEAVVLEGRSCREVARAHSVSRSWVGKLFGRSDPVGTPRPSRGLEPEEPQEVPDISKELNDLPIRPARPKGSKLFTRPGAGSRATFHGVDG